MSNLFPPAPPAYDPSRAVEVLVVRERPPRRYRLHAALLAATIFTTLLVGARLQYNFQHNLPAFSLAEDTLPLFPLRWVAEHPARILLGVTFSASLMLILLAHEMGHYLMALRYGVNATLPFFLPAPTLIGTLGAFIRIKSPIRSRAALFDIGIAGPIAGFVAASAVLLVALMLSKPMSADVGPSDIVLGYPLVFQAVHGLLGALGVSSGQVPLAGVYLHPMAVAAWVGMFATSLNLLPGGQLDGGHIVYALAPRAHRHLSNITVSALLTLGVAGVLRQMEILSAHWEGWPGWILWGVVVLLMGRRHPHVPVWPGLDRRRQWFGLIAVALLVLTFMPAPLYELALGR